MEYVCAKYLLDGSINKKMHSQRVNRLDRYAIALMGVSS